MTLSVDEYSKLSPDAQREYDNEERQRERSEQEGLPYRWNQMLDHVEVSIPLPPDVRARQIQVVFKPAWISVKMREECIVEVSLCIQTNALGNTVQANSTRWLYLDYWYALGNLY